MSDREPVVLVVLIQTDSLRWFVAGIDMKSHSYPLLRSEEGNLDEYFGLELDAQISFLRHRLAGVLQRGFDRLYARSMKANSILLAADGAFPTGDTELTERLANHFVQWMISPPVSYVVTTKAFQIQHEGDLSVVAGELSPSVSSLFRKALPSLVSQFAEPEYWELVHRPRRA